MIELWLIVAALGASFEEGEEERNASFAVGGDVTYSSDADGTEVLRSGLLVAPHYRSSKDFAGLRLEKVRFDPAGSDGGESERVYLQVAKPIADWQLNAQVGSDGHTVLGAASVHNDAPLRIEAFVERDQLETPLGVSQRLFATFGGAAIDFPLGDHFQLTILGGLQGFDGTNVRTHARANFIQVIKPDWGLSAQLRTRYSHNSVPNEADYFSPDWHVEILPVIQLRRFSGGWQYRGAVGWGAQQDSRSDWRSSRYLDLRVTSPTDRRGWGISASLTYTNQPITSSETYDYFRSQVGIVRAF
ncbi:hypothetical protein [Sphingomicrobium astaxanthinifaciens]|uniref:hypothetical protein n=1 Tax=Sphingomicrobium astaxanthinifaciens TaxID=1227949 RepID=UPI001FCAE9D0|nr:hypothetical protein [Sphingomicrobium astaxanthinifaciens]MCJ7420424.1 hypothetical protein [Sphingomicrobium astaxanthinifaciens]